MIMSPKVVGALIIGGAPRPDLVDPLIQHLPPDWQVLQAGALDGLEAASLPAVMEGTYPMTTRLGNGTVVMVEEGFLEPRLGEALRHLEAEGVAATLLLCAGTFAGLAGTRPLIKPFAVGRHLLRSLGLESLGLIAPIAEQEAPIRDRWLAAGFEATVWTADLARQDRGFHQNLQDQIAAKRLDCIVLDYVGHPAQYVKQLREATPLPVIDLGQLAMATLATIL